MDILRKAFPGLTDRQLQNRFYALKAIKLLSEATDQRYAPLLDEDTRSVSVLAELGRIGDPRTFVAAANWLLRARPKANLKEHPKANPE